MARRAQSSERTRRWNAHVAARERPRIANCAFLVVLAARALLAEKREDALNYCGCEFVSKQPNQICQAGGRLTLFGPDSFQNPAWRRRHRLQYHNPTTTTTTSTTSNGVIDIDITTRGAADHFAVSRRRDRGSRRAHHWRFERHWPGDCAPARSPRCKGTSQQSHPALVFQHWHSLAGNLAPPQLNAA